MSDSDSEDNNRSKKSLSKRKLDKKIDPNNNNTTNNNTNNTNSNNSKASSGYNWCAIGIMIMMALPMLIAGALQVTDYLYPEAARERDIKHRITERVKRCYNVANPDRLDDVDRFVEKYKGQEDKLLAKLREKYYKFSECH